MIFKIMTVHVVGIGIGIGIGLLKIHIAASKAELHEITV